MTRRSTLFSGALGTTLLIWAASSQAALVVNDTWQDADRTLPASPTYSENGVDGDADNDIESAWYNGGTGSVMTASAGNLQLDPASSSASWTTYFTPEASPVTLSSAGQFVKATWVFRTADVTNNTSQNFRAALFDSPAASRLVADGSPGSAAYTGYALFGNMGETTGNGNSFQLRERSVASGDLLSTSGNWAALGNGLGNSAVGYADNTQYTFTMQLTRNASSGLDITMTMTGGNIGGTGSVSVSVTDPSPSGFVYDTFSLRPSSQETTSTLFDTSLFRVEFVPEPASLALAGLGGLVLLARRRRI